MASDRNSFFGSSTSKGACLNPHFIGGPILGSEAETKQIAGLDLLRNRHNKRDEASSLGGGSTQQRWVPSASSQQRRHSSRPALGEDSAAVAAGWGDRSTLLLAKARGVRTENWTAGANLERLDLRAIRIFAKQDEVFLMDQVQIRSGNRPGLD